MHQSLRTLLAQCVDYAGLFPPAKLPIEEALRNYAGYCRSDEAWMLARFICPVERLVEIDPYASVVFGEGQPVMRMALTCPGGDDMPSFLSSFQQSVDRAGEFVVQRGTAVNVEMLEVRVPDKVVASGRDLIRELAERCAELIASSKLPKAHAVYEVSFKAGGPTTVAEALTALSSFNAEWAKEPRYEPVMAKIRTGGLTPDAFPTCNELAFFIAGCSRVGLPFKATAGLHQPLVHYDATLDRHVHGFINLFVAVALGLVSDPDLSLIVQVLETADGQDFDFDDGFLSWRNRQVLLDQISAARQVCSSFGSCSFTEPVEGLKALNLI